MSVIRTLIGNIRGPQGATGATGATGAAGANGADGAAATVNVGTVSTTAYGNPAQVHNSGTESAAVLDFVIPQGQPGEEVTDMAGLTLGTMTTQTAQFPTPQIGDNGATLWGKVVKYFSDLRTLIGTKLNTSNVVNNFTTTESGYALDARAGKTLNDSLLYQPGNSPTVQVCFIGKATNDKDGYFGCIPMSKAISTNVTSISFSNASGYGQWFSDGASHTINYANLTLVERHMDMIWCKLPATNIESSSSIAWVRLQVTIQFS